MKPVAHARPSVRRHRYTYTPVYIRARASRTMIINRGTVINSRREGRRALLPGRDNYVPQRDSICIYIVSN